MDVTKIVLASVAGAFVLFTAGSLYLNKVKTQQRQTGVILPRQETAVQHPLTEYEDGYDLPQDRHNLLYGSGKKSKRNKSKRNKSKKNK
jgi:hypothetical protein